MLEPKNCRTDLVEHLKQISLGHLAKSTYCEVQCLIFPLKLNIEIWSWNTYLNCDTKFKKKRSVIRFVSGLFA